MLLGFCGFEKEIQGSFGSGPSLGQKLLFGNVSGVYHLLVQTFVFFLLKPFIWSQVLGYSPDQSGLFMDHIPHMSDHHRASGRQPVRPHRLARLTSISYFLVSIAFIVFSNGYREQPWNIAAGLVTFGIGMGCFGSPITAPYWARFPRP